MQQYAKKYPVIVKIKVIATILTKLKSVSIKKYKALNRVDPKIQKVDPDNEILFLVQNKQTKKETALTISLNKIK